MKNLFTFLLLFAFTQIFPQCPWSITNPNSVPQYSCDQSIGNPVIDIGITGSTADLRYLITGYPIGTSFSPTHAIITSTDPAQSGVSVNSIRVSNIGTYTYKVTNTLTSCEQTGTVSITPFIDFQLQGYAPTTSVSCNGSIVVNPGIPANCTMAVTGGTGAPVGAVNGNVISNLCYGSVIVCVTYTAPSRINCKSCASMIINAATGVNEYLVNDNLLVYPNPSGSHFLVKNNGKVKHVKIFDVEGKLVETIVPGEISDIQISSLQPGIYFVEVQTDGYVVRKKISVLGE